MFKKLPIVLFSLLLLAAPLAAQDYQRGWTAFQKGDYATAIKEWRALGESGHDVAQFNLGLMYAKGLGLPKDETLAVHWYRRAAEQGHVDAQNNLGFMYGTGRGVEINNAEAVMWLRRAAEQGDADAQYNLGVMYMMGRGVPRDQTQALAWYRKAAGQGQAQAMDELEYFSKQRRAVASKPNPPASPVTPASTATAARAGTPAAATEDSKPTADQPIHSAPPSAPDTSASAPPASGTGTPPVASATGPVPPELPKTLPSSRPPKSDTETKTATATPAPEASDKASVVFRVQLLSVKTKARAAVEASRLTSRYKPVLGSLQVMPVRADLGDRGVFYRLRAGPLDSRAAATSLCRKLSARNQDCLVVTR